jgi:hypothetical protein
VKWRIYYGDGSIFDSSQGNPEDAPPDNVQIVVDRDPEVGRVLLTSFAGFYWFEAGRWFACLDQQGYGLFDYLRRPGLKIVKFGRTMETEAFREIYARAAQDTGFPRKSGWRPNEKPHWLTWSD